LRSPASPARALAFACFLFIFVLVVVLLEVIVVQFVFTVFIVIIIVVVIDIDIIVLIVILRLMIVASASETPILIFVANQVFEWTVLGTIFFSPHVYRGGHERQLLSLEWRYRLGAKLGKLCGTAARESMAKGMESQTIPVSVKPRSGSVVRSL
jgi:hypothetical protein